MLNGTISEQQQFLNIPSFGRLQVLELCTHKEDKSDIGTREIGTNASDVP